MSELPALLTLNNLRKAYQSGLSIDEMLRELSRRIEDTDNPIWIYRLGDSELLPYVERLKRSTPEDLPLYGVPFAIKDNIDLAGVPTSSACTAATYTPHESAFAVQRLIEAGAIPVGKTNLDQFATGLVGTRSPYGAVRNAFDDLMISGGSSSGSAVAVALGQVAFSLGTDTAGSGRVPAALNNLVGVKPTRGIVSTRGVVPACRTLDCVSLMTLNTEDAATVMDLLIAYDEPEPFARAAKLDDPIDKPVIGIAERTSLEFFGNDSYAQCYEQFVETVADHFETRTVEITPLLETANLLYDGAWVAERYHAAKALIEEQPEALLPEFKAVVEPARKRTAIDYFDGAYELAQYKRLCENIFKPIDCLLLPTVGTHHTIADVEAEPILRNSENGIYTNFVNLLDLAAVAFPAGFASANRPFGMTLLGQAMSDSVLLNLAQIITADVRPFGATGITMTETLIQPTMNDTMAIAVCGAHLEGMPLHGQLLERHATLQEATSTAPHYRLYALSGGPPYRPGLARTEADGSAIEVEVYNMPTMHIGSFLSGIPAPLGLGKLELQSGEWVTGFICEPSGIIDANDVTEFGGWRSYIASLESA